jgi:threonine dehydrogenase-like Zn-dependent dehydrogenase
MRRLFAPAAFAAAAFAILPTFALADIVEDNNGVDTSASASPTDTTFDLGIDVTGVPHDPLAVKSFISGLAPAAQSAVMGACESFMEHPDSIQSPETYAFCSNAIRG